MAEQGEAKSEIISYVVETGISNLGAVSADLLLGEVALAIINNDDDLQQQYVHFAEVAMSDLPTPESRELSDEFITGVIYGIKSLLLANRDIRHRQAAKSVVEDMGHSAFKEYHLKTVHGRE